MARQDVEAQTLLDRQVLPDLDRVNKEDCSDSAETVKLLCYCCLCLIGLVLGIVTICVAISRNANCSPEALSGVPVPYAGQIIPENVTMYERVSWFSKLVDVYDAANEQIRIGSFYDMNLVIFKRFGYSDASDRIWFEASIPWMWRLGEFYYLKRCDADAHAANAAIFAVDEDWHARPWFCWTSCSKKFDVRENDGGQDMDLADAAFSSTKEVYTSLQGKSFIKTRNKWVMNLTSASDGSQVAYAEQGFVDRGMLMKPLSRWTMAIKNRQQHKLPNWVVAFLVALDDIETS